MFDARGWQIYTYICMRLGPSGIGWLTFSELSWDLDFRSTAKLRVYVNALVREGWLLHSSSRAREYFFAPDPMHVIRAKHADGKIPPERAEAIDEVLDALKWPTLVPSRKRREASVLSDSDEDI
jgi:hypothetical protein